MAGARAGAGVGAGAGAEIMPWTQVELEPKINNFSSATQVQHIPAAHVKFSKNTFNM